MEISKHNRSVALAFFLSRHRNSYVSDAAFCCTFDGIAAISRQSKKVSTFQIFIEYLSFRKEVSKENFEYGFLCH
jgi:hypothetical protein